MGNLHNATYTYFLPIWEKNDNLIHFFSHDLDTKLQKSLLLIFVAIKTRKCRYNAQLLQRKKKQTKKQTNENLSRYKAKLSTINAKLFYKWIDGDQHMHQKSGSLISICAWGPPLWCVLNIGKWCMWRCLYDRSATCISYIPDFPTWSNWFPFTYFWWFLPWSSQCKMRK